MTISDKSRIDYMQEAAIKKRKLDRHSDIAVAPGFAMVLIMVILYGISREVSIL